MQLKVGEQDSDFRHARRVFLTVRMNHRQPQRFQIQQARRCLFGRHAELPAQFRINGFQPRLQPRVHGRVVIHRVILKHAFCFRLDGHAAACAERRQDQQAEDRDLIRHAGFLLECPLKTKNRLA